MQTKVFYFYFLWLCGSVKGKGCNACESLLQSAPGELSQQVLAVGKAQTTYCSTAIPFLLCAGQSIDILFIQFNSCNVAR
jgi:hypothetical protein